jgi:hypothetical protein
METKSLCTATFPVYDKMWRKPLTSIRDANLSRYTACWRLGGGGGGIAPTLLLRLYKWVSVQYHAPAALYPRERAPGNQCIGGWVSPRASLEAEVRGKMSASVGDRNSVGQSVVRLYIY